MDFLFFESRSPNSQFYFMPIISVLTLWSLLFYVLLEREQIYRAKGWNAKQSIWHFATIFWKESVGENIEIGDLNNI